MVDNSNIPTLLLISRRTWDESQCSCVCRATCLSGQEMEPGTCTCLPVSIATCSLAPVSLSTSHPAKIATYIGLIALTVLGLTIAVTLYYIVIRLLGKIHKVEVFFDNKITFLQKASAVSGPDRLHPLPLHHSQQVRREHCVPIITCYSCSGPLTRLRSTRATMSWTQRPSSSSRKISRRKQSSKSANIRPPSMLSKL